jgi:hypothetical protein
VQSVVFNKLLDFSARTVQSEWGPLKCNCHQFIVKAGGRCAKISSTTKHISGPPSELYRVIQNDSTDLK